MEFRGAPRNSQILLESTIPCYKSPQKYLSPYIYIYIYIYVIYASANQCFLPHRGILSSILYPPWGAPTIFRLTLIMSNFTPLLYGVKWLFFPIGNKHIANLSFWSTFFAREKTIGNLTFCFILIFFFIWGAVWRPMEQPGGPTEHQG
jgi:hypothetical protein